MPVNIGAQFNAICLFRDHQPGDGDHLSVLRQKRPNTMFALDRFEEKWRARELGPDGAPDLDVTVLLDLCGGWGVSGKQRLAKTKTGYSAAIAMRREDLMVHAQERDEDDILRDLEEKMSEILERPALRRIRSGGG